MLEEFLDCLFPRKSLRGEVGTFVTEGERRELHPFPIRLDQPLLQREMGVRSLDRVVAAGSYARCPLLRKAIYTLKYSRIPALSSELGLLMVRAVPLLGLSSTFSSSPSLPSLPSIPPLPSFPVLSPVPLHFLREFSRGFNQAELLARVVAQETGWEMSSLLRRRFPTGSQVRRSRRERKQAMRGAFSVVTSQLPEIVILIDDVLTSGATFDACARALKEGGAKWVGGLVLALG